MPHVWYGKAFLLVLKTMGFGELGRNLYQPQIDEVWGSFTERERAVIENCASRGWNSLQGPDFQRLVELGKTALREMAEVIWSSLHESYRVSKVKPPEMELKAFMCERIDRNAHSLAETIAHLVKQHQFGKGIDGYDGPVQWVRGEIERQRVHVSNLLFSRLNLLLEGMSPASDGGAAPQPENPLILRPTIFGVGIDLGKVLPWISRRLMKKDKNRP